MSQNKIQRCAVLFLVVCLSACGGIAFGPGLNDFDAELIHGYALVQYSAHEILISKPASHNRNTGVYAKVVSLGYDDRYILAKQQLLDTQEKHPLTDKFQYWIIDAPVEKQFGPLTEDEFHAKRKELGVSEKIELKDKNEYRP